MESYYISGAITFMPAQTSEYKWMTGKMCSNEARTILSDLIFWENSI